MPPRQPTRTIHYSGRRVGDTLTFLTTDSCDIRCRHCLMSAAPGRRQKLTYDDFKRRFDEIVSMCGTRLVVFSGGEPTLLGQDLLNMIAYASENGVATRMVTNGSWASTGEAARSYLIALRECGLNELNVSLDDYHAEWVPVTHVWRILRHAEGLGFTAVVVALSWHEDADITPPWVLENAPRELHLLHEAEIGKTYCPVSSDGTAYILAEHGVQKSGRAQSEDIKQSHSLTKWAGHRCGSAMRELTVGPNGGVYGCCGFDIVRRPAMLVTPPSKAFDWAIAKDVDIDPVLLSFAEVGPTEVWSIWNNACTEAERGRFTEPSEICEVCEILTRPRNMRILRNQENVLWTELLRARVAEDLHSSGDTPDHGAESQPR